MEQKKSYEIDMCNGPILSKMLLFTIPLMCSSMLQLLFNAADIVVVGRYAGDNSLAAVGSNTSLIGLLTNLFLGLSIGANVLVARYYGAKREEELKHIQPEYSILEFQRMILRRQLNFIKSLDLKLHFGPSMKRRMKKWHF